MSRKFRIDAEGPGFRDNSEIEAVIDLLKGYEVGSHYCFKRSAIHTTFMSAFTTRSAKAKPYQVKQVRNVILKYKLNLGADNE